MRRFIIFVILTLFLISCVSIQDRPLTMASMNQVVFLGEVTTQFNSFQGPYAIIHSNGIKQKAYTELMKIAKQQYQGNIEIMNINITGKGSGWTAFNILLGYPLLLSNVQRITATGNVVMFSTQENNRIIAIEDSQDQSTVATAQVQPAILPARPVSSSSTSLKYALVIGNGNYTSFGRLPNALNDANDMKTTLEGLGFIVDIVTDSSRAQMAESIARLKNRLSVSKNSYGFFFYAGHGLQHNGINYLIPARADIPNANYLGDTSISVQTLLAELNDAGNDLNIIILDACRDFPAAWSRSLNRGLTVVANQPADSIIVFATSAGSTASDGTGRNGLFTSHLLRYLRTPGLEVTEIFRLTGADVSQASNRQQIPAMYNQFFGRAYFNIQP